MSYVQKQKWEALCSSCPKSQNLTTDRVYEQPHQNTMDHFLSWATWGKGPSALGIGHWELDSDVLFYWEGGGQSTNPNWNSPDACRKWVRMCICPLCLTKCWIRIPGLNFPRLLETFSAGIRPKVCTLNTTFAAWPCLFSMRQFPG